MTKKYDIVISLWKGWTYPCYTRTYTNAPIACTYLASVRIASEGFKADFQATCRGLEARNLIWKEMVGVNSSELLNAKCFHSF